jgi:hypothetical protein
MALEAEMMRVLDAAIKMGTSSYFSQWPRE